MAGNTAQQTARRVDVSNLDDPSVDGSSVSRQFRILFDPENNTAQRPVATYSFEVGLPDNAVITRSWYDVLTTFQSPTTDAATISIGIQSDDVAGIKAAIDINDGGAPWDAGFVEGIQTGAASAFSTRTAADNRPIDIIIGVEAVTNGTFVLFCDYTVSD